MKGIVFDFDGTLVRSMELHAEAYRRTLAPLKIRVTERDVFLREGARSETIIKSLALAAGRKLDEAEIKRLADQKQDLYATLGPPTLYPGAKELVESLHRMGAKMGLVSGTRRENLERIVPDLIPKFDAVLGAGDYEKDKPDPEPYAKTVAKMGLVPSDCAALENAIRGVRSAREAGLAFVVAITTTLSRSDLRGSGAHLIVASHESAEQALQHWLSAKG